MIETVANVTVSDKWQRGWGDYLVGEIGEYL
jgi:hypothetical protein